MEEAVFVVVLDEWKVENGQSSVAQLISRCWAIAWLSRKTAYCLATVKHACQRHPSTVSRSSQLILHEVLPLFHHNLHSTLSHTKYSGRIYLSFCLSPSFCLSDRGIIDDLMHPTSSVRIPPSRTAVCRSSRMFSATTRDVCAFACKTLNTSSTVTEPSFSLHES